MVKSLHALNQADHNKEKSVKKNPQRPRHASLVVFEGGKETAMGPAARTKKKTSPQRQRSPGDHDRGGKDQSQSGQE